MAQILSRYSKSKDLTQNVEFESMTAYMKAVAEGYKGDPPGDFLRPYTFRQWYSQQVGIIPGQEYILYNSYLKNWYSTRNQSNPVNVDTREAYLNLLNQIEASFDTDEEKEIVKGLNYSSTADLIDAIPFYAERLKNIAKYISLKRDTIKKAKLKYNMSGSNQAIEKLFYEYLLKAFTKNKSTNEYTVITELSTLNSLPSLSAVTDTFGIQIEEIYDDTSYFDKNPSAPVSSYYINTAATSAFLADLNITADQFDWLYSTGMAQLCADNPLLWIVDDVLSQYTNQELPLSAIDDVVNNTLNEYNKIALASKYLGETQYIISGGYYIPNTTEYNYSFAKGNNWFYWPSGGNIYDNDSKSSFQAINLSATDLNKFGSASVEYKTADKILTIQNNKVQAAWLQKGKVIPNNFTMEAVLYPGTNNFAFPYPGYGISGEDIEWEGRVINNYDQTIKFLEEEYKEAVYKKYWSTTLPVSVIQQPISLMSTNLVENGAYADKTPWSSDTITIRPRIRVNENETVYSGQQDIVFLYKVDKTDLPVVGSDVYFRWPYEVYTDTPQYTDSMFENTSEDIYLSSIPLNVFSGAVAGNTFETSDAIYELDGPKGNIVAGAWLSAAAVSGICSNNVLLSSIEQPGLSIKIPSAGIANFVWHGDTTDPLLVFKNLNHKPDCDFNNNTTNDVIELQSAWKTCNCQSIWFSPFGHDGETISDNDEATDIILKNTCYYGVFSKESWRGSDGKDYKSSIDAIWFKTKSGTGWVEGEWVSGSPDASVATFLQPNNKYTYIRYGLQNNTGPIYVINYAYNKNNAAWKALTKNTNNEWISTTDESKLQFKAGHYYRYIHKNYTPIKSAATQLVSVTTTNTNANLDNNVWVNYSYVITGTNFNVTWPSTYYVGKNITTSNNLCAINFFLKSPGEQTFTNILSSPSFGLTGLGIRPETSVRLNLQQTGAYTISAVGRLYNSRTPESHSFTITSAPSITTVSTTLSTVSSITENVSAIDFVLNVELFGWNYTYNRFEEGFPGARPIWGVVSYNSDDITKYKSYPYMAGVPRKVADYTWITQPQISLLALSGDNYIEYNRRGSERFIWTQPIIQYKQDYTDNKWCELLVDTTQNSYLSSVLRNDWSNLNVTAANVDTSIILNISKESPLLINYYAQNAFTWNTALTDVSLGVPPSGGLWVPIVSGELIKAAAPYANLLNRHFPTYASVPYIENLYTEKDVGGFMTPQHLGLSTALSKFNKNELYTKGKSFINSKSPLSRIYRDLEAYTNDRGLTNDTIITPVTTFEVDSSWMKAAPIEGKRAGRIVDARSHQEFIPYQTSFETHNYNKHGIVRQNDDIETFGAVMNQLKGSELYQWRQDVFGNDYGLHKFYDNDLSIQLVIPSAVCLDTSYSYLAQTTRKRIQDKTIPLFSYKWEIDSNTPELFLTNDIEYNLLENKTFTSYGNHTIKVTVTDTQGNTAQDQKTVFARYCVAPIPLDVEIEGPSAVCTYSNKTYNALITAKQYPFSDVKNHSWYFNGQLVSAISSVSAGDLSAISSFITTFPYNGSYDLTVIVEDAEGNTASDTLYIESYPCTDLAVELGGPVNVCVGTPYNYRASVTENCSVTGCIPISSYQLWIDGSLDTTQPGNDDDSGFFNNKLFSAGAHTLCAIVVDVSGNIASNALAINSTVCTVPSSYYGVSIEGPGIVCNNSTSAYAYSAFAISGVNAIINGYTWFTNGTPISSITTSTSASTIDIDFNGYTAGISSVSVQITSNVGGVSATNQSYFPIQIVACPDLSVTFNIINKLCYPRSYTFTGLATYNVARPISAWKWFVKDYTGSVIGNQISSIQTSATQTSYVFNQPISNRPSGSTTYVYEVCAFVYDISGNVATAVQSATAINCFTSVLSSVLIGNSVICNNNHYTYSLQVTSNPVAISGYYFGTDNIWSSFIPTTATSYSYLYDPSVYGEGTLSAQVIDVYGYTNTQTKNISVCPCRPLSVQLIEANSEVCIGRSKSYTVTVTNALDTASGVSCRNVPVSTINFKHHNTSVSGTLTTNVSTFTFTLPNINTFTPAVTVTDILGNKAYASINITTVNCPSAGRVEIPYTYATELVNNVNNKPFIASNSVNTANCSSVSSDSQLGQIATNTNIVWLPRNLQDVVYKVKIKDATATTAANALEVLGAYKISPNANAEPSRTYVLPNRNYSVWIGNRSTNEIVYLDNTDPALVPGTNTSNSVTPRTYGEDAALKYVVRLKNTNKATIIPQSKIKANTTTDFVKFTDRSGGIRAIVCDSSENVYVHIQTYKKWFIIPKSFIPLSVSDYDNTTIRTVPVNVLNTTTDKVYGAIMDSNDRIWWIQRGNGILGVVDTKTNKQIEFSSMGSDSYGMTIYQNRYIVITPLSSNGVVCIIDTQAQSVINHINSLLSSTNEFSTKTSTFSTLLALNQTVSSSSALYPYSGTPYTYYPVKKLTINNYNNFNPRTCTVLNGIIYFGGHTKYPSYVSSHKFLFDRTSQSIMFGNANTFNITATLLNTIGATQELHTGIAPTKDDKGRDALILLASDDDSNKALNTPITLLYSTTNYDITSTTGLAARTFTGNVGYTNIYNYTNFTGYTEPYAAADYGYVSFGVTLKDVNLNTTNPSISWTSLSATFLRSDGLTSVMPASAKITFTLNNSTISAISAFGTLTTSPTTFTIAFTGLSIPMNRNTQTLPINVELFRTSASAERAYVESIRFDKLIATYSYIF